MPTVPPERTPFGDRESHQVPTSGFWAQIPDAGRRELLAGIGAAVDAAGGSFTMRYVTVAVTATRTATS